MAEQILIAEFAHLFRQDWKPNPHTLARVKNYLEGFAAHGREIRWKLRTAAARLDMGRSTLCRYLRWLREEKWLATVKNTMRYAIRKVLSTVKLASSSGTPCGTPSKVKPEASQNPLKQNSSDAPSSGGEPYAQGERAAKPLPLGYSEAFSNYIGIFYAAGKAMNVQDVHRAHAAWIGVGPEHWAPATKHALEQCQRTRHAQFVPMPVNHLLDRGWTRVAPERTLPFEPPKQPTRGELAQDSAARRFLARFK